MASIAGPYKFANLCFMLGKILITFAVILAAVIVLKRRSQPSEQNTSDNKARGEKQASKSVASKDESLQASDLRLAAYMFLTLMFGAAIILYYQRWQDDHTILTVELFRDGGAASVAYEVYKYQFDSPSSRTFTTIDGTLITVAENERMEVVGLE